MKRKTTRRKPKPIRVPPLALMARLRAEARKEAGNTTGSMCGPIGYLDKHQRWLRKVSRIFHRKLEEHGVAVEGRL